MDTEELKAKLEQAAKMLCGMLVPELDTIDIEVSVTASVIVITLGPEKKDLGMIIGRKGKNIEAIRTLISAYTNRYRYRCHVEVNE